MKSIKHILCEIVMLYILIIFNLFIGLKAVDTQIRVKSKMNMRDKAICFDCLEIVRKLKIIKNSSLCELQKTLILSITPEKELMCYEIYYYFYYFKQDFFYDDGQIEMNFGNEFYHRKENECNICSNLDKCEYYECVSGFNFDNNLNNKNNKIKKSKGIISLQFNSTNILKNKYVSLQASSGNATHISPKQFQNQSNEAIQLRNIPILDQVIKNHPTPKTAVKNSSKLIIEKQNAFINESKNVKFISLNTKKNFLKKIREEPEEDEYDNLLTDHFYLLKLKIQHILDELVNLSNIHNTAKEIRKKFINMLIFNKLQNENKIDSSVKNKSPIIKITNKDNLKNYLNNIKKLSDKFLEIFDLIETNVEKDGKQVIGIENIRNVNYVNVENSINNLNSFLQAFNELFKLGHIIFNSNIKLLNQILKDFTEEKLIFNKVENNPQIDDERINRIKTDHDIIANLTMNSTKVGSFSQQAPTFVSNEIKLLIEKISNLEKQQIMMNSFLNNLDLGKSINNIKKSKTRIEKLNNNIITEKVFEENIIENQSQNDTSNFRNNKNVTLNLDGKITKISNESNNKMKVKENNKSQKSRPETNSKHKQENFKSLMSAPTNKNMKMSLPKEETDQDIYLIEKSNYNKINLNSHNPPPKNRINKNIKINPSLEEIVQGTDPIDKITNNKIDFNNQNPPMKYPINQEIKLDFPNEETVQDTDPIDKDMTKLNNQNPPLEFPINKNIKFFPRKEKGENTDPIDKQIFLEKQFENNDDTKFKAFNPFSFKTNAKIKNNTSDIQNLQSLKYSNLVVTNERKEPSGENQNKNIVVAKTDADLQSFHSFRNKENSFVEPKNLYSESFKSYNNLILDGNSEKSNENAENGQENNNINSNFSSSVKNINANKMKKVEIEGIKHKKRKRKTSSKLFKKYRKEIHNL